jgi:hypothetical protein
MLAVQGGILGGHKSAPVSHKHMLSHPYFSSPLINEDLPAGPQLVLTLNYRFFRHQACYSLLPAMPSGQADRVVSLCKYKVVSLADTIHLFHIYPICTLGLQCSSITDYSVYGKHEFFYGLLDILFYDKELSFHIHMYCMFQFKRWLLCVSK